MIHPRLFDWALFVAVIGCKFQPPSGKGSPLHIHCRPILPKMVSAQYKLPLRTIGVFFCFRIGLYFPLFKRCVYVLQAYGVHNNLNPPIEK